MVLQRPKLQQSTDDDEAVAKVENEEFRIEFQDAIKRHNKNVDNLQQGLDRAYGLIWSDYMTASMINRIEQHPDNVSKIKGAVIALIKAIKASMHETTRAQKPILSAIQAITKLFNYKQGDSVSLSQYIKGSKEHRDVLKTQLGDHLFDFFCEQQSGWEALTELQQKAEKDNMLDEVLGILFILNSDQHKYGSIKTDLGAAFTRGRDEYPFLLTKAIDMLDTHTLDNTFKEHKKKSNNKNDKSNKHLRSEKSFAQKKKEGPTVCFCCGSKDHKRPDCKWEKKIPKSEWYKQTGKVPSQVKTDHGSLHAQADDSGDKSALGDDEDKDSSVASSRSNRSSQSRSNRRSGQSSSRTHRQRKGWSNFLITAKQDHQNHDDDLRDVFIINTGSTISATITNPDLITNLRPAKKVLRMSTNAGMKQIALTGDVLGFGEAWYNPDMMTYIFGFSLMADKYRVTYDSSIKDAIIVHTNTGIVKFKRSPKGLYVYKPTEKFLKAVAVTKNPVSLSQVVDGASTLR